VDGGGRLEKRVSAGLTTGELRKFAWTVGAAFLVLAGIVAWRGHMSVASAFGAAGLLLGAGGLLAPSRLGPVYRAWMGFSLAISKVTTPVFMGIVFFLVIGPTGAILRAMGRNPVVRREIDGGYWVPRSGEGGGRSDLKRQF
jgi:hypothetical protein